MGKIEVTGHSLAQLDRQRERFAATVDAALHASMLDTQQALALVAAGPGADDARVALRAWYARVTDELVPVVLSTFRSGALAVLTSLRRALPALDVSTLPTPTDDYAQLYLADATNRLNGVGDELWAETRAALVEGQSRGESVEELAARVTDVADVVASRAQTIARTEIISASNAGSIAQMSLIAADGDLKQWLATGDTRTRESHRLADGQAVPLDSTFDVGGSRLRYPGDPQGPADEIVNCRCTLTYELTDELLTGDSVDTLTAATDPLDGLPNVEPSLGRGGTVNADVDVDDDEGVDTDEQTDEHTGAMIALVPSADDVKRLALAGGEAPDDLHLTLFYLGDAANFNDAQRAALLDDVAQLVTLQPAVEATGFGAALWNPTGAEPAVVLNVGGDVLQTVHDQVCDLLCSSWADVDLAEQYVPWVPHVCLAYTSDASTLTDALQRVGPITFDRVRVAFAGQSTDFPLYATNTTAMVAAADTEEVPLTDTQLDVSAAAPTGTGMAVSSGVPGSWEGILVVEGVETGDGREFALGSLDFAPMWVPLNYAKENLGEHMGSVTVARIDQMWRDPTNPAMIRGKGVFDLGSSEGQEAYGAVQRGFLKGVSVDVDSVKDADVEYVYSQPDDPEADGSVEDELAELFAMPDKIIFHKGRVRGATLVSLPAFVEAQVWLTDGTMTTLATDSPPATGADGDTGYALLALEHGCSDDVGAVAAQVGRIFSDAAVKLDRAQRRLAYDHLRAHLEHAGLVPQAFENDTFSDEVRSLLASSATVDYDAPPAKWFENPRLDRLTPLTVTEDGRVYGHAADWNSAHMSFQDTVVRPPREGEHVYFRLGEVVTAEGTRVATGTITLGTGHAPTYGVDPRRAVEHYDNTGTAVADVASGEDEHGIWVAGAVRPGVTAARVAELRAAKLSGDWRRIGGQLRLVALLAVNVPGFAVPRLRAEVSEGRQLALVAAGILPDHEVAAERAAIRSVAASLARRLGRDPRSRAAELKARVHKK